MSTITTRWHFVRHAPVLAAESLLYATHDEPADCSDVAAFEALAQRLPRDAVLVTSGLKRTEATADALLAAGLPVAERLVEPRLAEQHYGDWHGASLESLQADRTDRPRHKFWFTTATDLPPRGESFVDVAMRVAAAMDELSARFAGRNLVAVGHGGSIRAALAHALGLDLERALTISVENLSTTRVDQVTGDGIGGDWRVVYVNRRPNG